MKLYCLFFLISFLSISTWAEEVTTTVQENEEFTAVATEETTEITLIPGPVACEYKKKDLFDKYDVDSNIVVKCDNKSCDANGKNVVTSEGFVNITSAGTFIIQGQLDGQVHIEATKYDFVHLILDDVTINSNDGPAIYGASAGKITITVVGNNTLNDSTSYTLKDDEESDAAVYINSNLSINGSGSLTVTGNYNDAIKCKKNLRLIDATIIVPSAIGKGIKAVDSICVKDANLDITSVDSAIKATGYDDPEKGYIVIDSGNIKVSSKRDGIHAETHLTINDGYIDIQESNEGIESQMIDILGGEVHVLSSNDGINASKTSPEKDAHETATETITSTPTSLPTGYPDNIYNSNAQKEKASGTDGSIYINIVGGKVYVTTLGNNCDGIDSNGVLYIGGKAEVYTSINGGNVYGNIAALDADGFNAILPKATVVATGSSQGRKGVQDDTQEIFKEENEKNSDDKEINNKEKEKSKDDDENDEDNDSRMDEMDNEFGSIYQPYIYTTVASQKPGTSITIKNNNDEVIASYTPSIKFSTLLVTSPKMIANETYTIILGDDVTQTAIASEADIGDVDSPSIEWPTLTIEDATATASTATPTNEFTDNEIKEAPDEIFESYTEDEGIDNLDEEGEFDRKKVKRSINFYENVKTYIKNMF